MAVLGLTNTVKTGDNYHKITNFGFQRGSSLTVMVN